MIGRRGFLAALAGLVAAPAVQRRLAVVGETVSGTTSVWPFHGPLHGASVGDYILLEDEVLRVTSVGPGESLTVSRNHADRTGAFAALLRRSPSIHIADLSPHDKGSWPRGRKGRARREARLARFGVRA